MIVMQAFLIALSKSILRIAIGKALDTVLPKIFEKIDTKIPAALYNGAPPEIIKLEIGSAIQQVTGKPASKNVIDIVTMLYDPIQNAVSTRYRAK